MQWFGTRKAGWYRKGSAPKREEEINLRKREKREERRAQREARREKREEITKKAARDPQMRLFEQQQLTDNRVCWPLGRRDG